MIKFLDLFGQYRQMEEEMNAAIANVIRDSAFIGGRAVGDFEAAFASYLSVQNCVGVANGTDAIEIIIEAFAFAAGSEIIVPANSFVGSSEPVTRGGHQVVFADVDPTTYTLDLADVERRITQRTKAILAVHLYGQACDMDGLAALGAAHGLKIIEDCAQAHGTVYNGRHAGTLGDAAAFSFYPGKNLGAYGDGGAITTNDARLATRCRMIANHGRIEKYNHAFEGRNSRLDGLQAAVLCVKLKHLDSWVAARNAIARMYNSGLAGIGDLVLPAIPVSGQHAFHLYVVRTQARDSLRRALGEVGIETGIHYPIALPKLAAYASLGQAEESMFANRADETLLSLPIGEHLKSAEVQQVIEAAITFFASAGGSARRGESRLATE